MRTPRVRDTVPEVGSSTPTRIRMSEVLPIPLGPTMAMRAPLTTEKDTPLKISVGPYDFASEFTVISDMFSSFLFERPVL